MADDYDNGTADERRSAGRRRSDEVIAYRLHVAEGEIATLERRLDKMVSREELGDRLDAFGARLRIEYVPRDEHRQKRDWNLRIWLGAISVGGLLVAAGELLIALRIN
jgi:hypothetical protein